VRYAKFSLLLRNEEFMESLEKEYKEKVIALLSALFPGAKIYLFGSRARGTHAPFSDIDIALDAGVPIEPRRRVGEAAEVLCALYMPYRVDVVDMYRISDDMREQIIKEGVLWKD
jgi:predicted nucleotidyltransferase